MSSRIESVVRDLIGVNNTIGAIAVLDNNGRVIYTTENWQVDGSDVVNSWRKRDPSVTIQSVKYSTLQTTEERLIATNKSKGHIVMSTVGDKALLLAYVLPQGDAQGSYADVCRAADQIRRVI
jgi:predicted regulator of Ras-like GTPase activity (Roadblock/LC7/MglB family)